VTWQSTSPDGDALATGGTDGTIRLWDVRTEQPIGSALPGLPNREVAPQFLPDGPHLLAITNAGRAYRRDVRPSSWARHDCQVAGRPPTPSEWEDVLPRRDYARACGSRPTHSERSTTTQPSGAECPTNTRLLLDEGDRPRVPDWLSDLSAGRDDLDTLPRSLLAQPSLARYSSEPCRSGTLSSDVEATRRWGEPTSSSS
jgi:hypothetical protein